MNRRDLLKTAALAVVGANVPVKAVSEPLISSVTLRGAPGTPYAGVPLAMVYRRGETIVDVVHLLDPMHYSLR